MTSPYLFTGTTFVFSSPILRGLSLYHDNVITLHLAASHGEGWGRPIIEAMAMGLPTIVPVWGGVTAYATDDIVIPIVVSISYSSHSI